jgi:hypothetical protein
MPASQPLWVQTVLTNAQIKALPTTAVEILPAPGVGKCVFPLFAMLHMHWAADYTNIDASAEMLIKNGNQALLSSWSQTVASAVSSLLAGGGPDGTWAWAVLIGNIASSVTFGASGPYDSDIANLPLLISATNGGAGDFTGGNVANELEVTVQYLLVEY